ncbi:MAG: NADH:ubiquinone reductase (Na(+)-transporting) subunit C [Prevotellaceae bacterium]|jgi:Na+-transporting NADH:ubiquinone oxidoreductase subunit C|nr:NADH:ubiquinone reductase (Na(+)-transporting) subunit C [Prevotellaceae bacterium]
MNTNSNSYTITYASVLVIIVAFVLAFTSAALRDRQTKNQELDKMKQILAALKVDTKGGDAEAMYKQYIQADEILDHTGAVQVQTGGFEIDMATEMNKPETERKLPIYICEVNGARKYVLPLSGAGLWGPIWGYIALDEDKSTVYGAYFSHAAETPGLGAEIAEKPFQAEFVGKHALKNYEVALTVAKFGKVTDPTTEVDGISGGTLTSNGVNAMIKDCLKQYITFLTTKDNKEG